MYLECCNVLAGLCTMPTAHIKYIPVHLNLKFNTLIFCPETHLNSPSGAQLTECLVICIQIAGVMSYFHIQRYHVNADMLDWMSAFEEAANDISPENDATPGI